jgi:y4mF family transcriptional regulator
MMSLIADMRRRGDCMRVQTPSDLGIVIRERRQALGWDQQSLAERAGVGRQWIVAIEKGKARAALGLVLRTLAALELRVLVEDGSAPHAGPRVAGDRTIDEIVASARRPASAKPPPRARRTRS